MKNVKKIAILLISIFIALILFACSGPVTDREVTVSFQGKEYEGLYTGEFSKGQPSGTGIFTNSEEDVVLLTYEGAFEDGKMTGKGTLDFSFLTLVFQEEELIVRYKGDAVDGLPSGTGTLTYEKDDDWLNYEGELTDGKMTGKGTLDFSFFTFVFQEEELIVRYKGDAVDGLPSGTGTLIYENDDDRLNYEGGLTDGKMTGKGTLDTSFLKVQDKNIPDAGQYKGDVVDGVPNGEGELSAVNSEGKEFTYTGSWKDGLFNGQGSKKWKYTGYAADQAGTFTDGIFTPTFYEYLVNHENDPDFTFTLTKKAQTFLKKQEALFPVDDSEKIMSYVDESIDRKKWMKDPENFGDKIIKITGPITDMRLINNETWTCFVLYDWSGWDKNVTIFYPGKISLSVGDKITVYGLPLASGDYENIFGSRTDTCVMAGSFIKK